jgi:hypothetical protein
MIIVPIGIDCGVAETLKKYDIRKFALPFDWVVSYRGIKNILENNFINYIPDKILYNDINGTAVFNNYDVKFIHDKFDLNDISKYNRRIDRLRNILNNNTEKVFFIKKGHSYHHHNEYNFIDDVDDVIELNDFLKNKYPMLNYRIILVILCKFCCKNRDLNNLSPNIIIINEPILDIRDNPLHNKILTGKYFEKIFIEKINSILST